MRVAIVGCGVIGTRRADNLPAGTQITACFDIDAGRAAATAAKYGAKAFASLDALLEAKVADAAVVATINSAAVPTVQRCLRGGLHVLVEKPAARAVSELQQLEVPPGRIVKVGFNHRFHPAFTHVREEVAKRPADPIMFVRARYGNGARKGFDREWRANVELAGGGELLDQGVHVLDLAAVLVPGLDVRAGYCRTHYWDMPVDDNAWAILCGARGETFEMHVSSSEWKNEFQFDVYTRGRKYTWSGLGRSYGPETLTIHTMKPEMGPPETQTLRFEGEDPSWRDEWRNFEDAIAGRAKIDGGIEDAISTLGLVEKIYAASATLPHPAPHPEWWKSNEP